MVTQRHPIRSQRAGYQGPSNTVGCGYSKGSARYMPVFLDDGGDALVESVVVTDPTADKCPGRN